MIPLPTACPTCKAPGILYSVGECGGLGAGSEGTVSFAEHCGSRDVAAHATMGERPVAQCVASPGGGRLKRGYRGLAFLLVNEMLMHRLRLPFILCCWLVLGLLVCAQAATLHVSTSGSDGNPCTQAAPCRTIQHGITILSSGDTLTIHGGTYAENHFTPPSNVTVQGATGETVIIRPTSGANDPCFELNAGVTNTTIRNLTCDGANQIFSYGIRVFGTDNLIEDVEIAYPRNQGLALFCASGNTQGCGHGGNTLRRVHSHHAGQGSAGCNGTSPGPGFCHGVYAYNDDNVIDGGEYDHNNGWGVQTYGFNLTLKNAVVHENFSGGLTVPGSVSAYNSVFWGNDPTGNNATVWSSNSQSFYRSLTIANNGGIGLYFPSGTSSSTVVQNVISVNNSPNVSNAPGVTIQASITSGSVAFTNQANHDYSLTASATNAIDKGLTLGAPYNTDILGNTRPTGSVYDIGAYEFGSAPQAPVLPAPTNLRITKTPGSP